MEPMVYDAYEMKVRPLQKRSLRGFSLVEALTVVAVIGVLAGISFIIIGNLSVNSKRMKLSNDMRVLNSALGAYLGFGGNLKGDESPDQVFMKLKSRAKVDTADRIIGLRGYFLDPRFETVMQTKEEASTDMTRILWNASDSNFALATSGPVGIKEVRLNQDYVESDGDPVEARKTVMDYAHESTWIWDYQEEPRSAPLGPSTILTSNVPNSIPPSTGAPLPPPIDPVDTGSGPTPPPPIDPAVSDLTPPQVSVTGGSYSITNYDLSVSLLDSNPGGAAILVYSLNYGSWQDYGGAPISVAPGEVLKAQALPSDSTAYRPSGVITESYEADPEKLRLAATADSQAVTYFDLVDSVLTVKLEVSNLSAFPDFLVQPGMFSTYWTGDGSDPGNSASATLAGTYALGYQGDVIPLSPSLWSGQAELEIRGQAKAADSPWVQSSDVNSVVIRAVTDVLPAPQITLQDQGDGTFLATVAVAGRLPAGYGVYVNTAGGTPAYSGEGDAIAGGQLYSGPFVWQPSGAGGGPPGDTVQIQRGVNNVLIEQVVLNSNGADIVQNQSYYFDILETPGFDAPRDSEVVNSSDSVVTFETMTVNVDGESLYFDDVNALNVTVSNFGYPDSGSNSDVIIKNGATDVADLGDFRSDPEQFARDIETTLSSRNLRDYIEYSAGSKDLLSPIDHDFDVSFSALTNDDILIVAERFGNSWFDLRPLDANGDLIPGGKRVEFREYAWNTGYAPTVDGGNQSFFLTAIDISQFGVDTDVTTIGGFRVNNDGGADFKFFNVGTEPFEDRPVRFSGNVTARTFPPDTLRNWFSPSEVSSVSSP